MTVQRIPFRPLPAAARLLLATLLGLLMRSTPASAAELVFRDPLFGAAAAGRIVAVSLDARCEAGLLRTTWSVALRSLHERPVEARLRFRLAPGTLVEGAAIVEANRRIEVRPVGARAGRRAYEAVVARTLDPLLLSGDGDRITARLFPLPPGETLTLEIRLVAALPLDAGVARFDHPFAPHAPAGSPPHEWGYGAAVLRRFMGPAIIAGHEEHGGGGATVRLLCPDAAVRLDPAPRGTISGTGEATIAQLDPSDAPATITLRFAATVSSPPLRARIHPGAPGEDDILHLIYRPGAPPAPVAPRLVVDSSGSTRGTMQVHLAETLASVLPLLPGATARDLAGNPATPAALRAARPFGPSDPAAALADAAGTAALILADPGDLDLAGVAGRALLLHPVHPATAAGLSESLLLALAAGQALLLDTAEIATLPRRLHAPAVEVRRAGILLFSGDLPLLADRETHLFLRIPAADSLPVELRHAGESLAAEPLSLPAIEPGARTLADAAALFRAGRLSSAEFTRRAAAAALLTRRTSLLAVPPEVAAAMIGLDPLLSAFAPPNFNRARHQAKNKACISNMKTIEGAVELYLMEKTVPADALAPGILTLVREGYLKTPPRCPANGDYSIRFVPGPVPLTTEILCGAHGSVNEAHALGILDEPDRREQFAERLRELADAARIPLYLLLLLLGS